MQDLIKLVAGVKNRREGSRKNFNTIETVKTLDTNPDDSWPTIRESNPPRPYINDRGNLVIPFKSDERYHYWNGGQSLAETIVGLEENSNKKGVDNL